MNVTEWLNETEIKITYICIKNGACIVVLSLFLCFVSQRKVHTQTCIKRSPLGPIKSGLIRHVTP